jgi:transcriptional antiterminator RfaH
MLILPPETSYYPEYLFDRPGAALRAGRAWWVLHTRPCQEKRLARHLLRRQVPFYLPLIARTGGSRGAVPQSSLPLFPGCVFLLAAREERVTALATGRIARRVPVADQEQLWHDLGQVRRLIATGAPVTPEDRLAPGTPVEICRGPLGGLKGHIVGAATGRRFVVQVDCIRRGASVPVDGFNLAAIAVGRG